MKQESICISKWCAICGKLANTAVKVSDFWICRCADCEGKPVTLDSKAMR